MSEKEPEKPKQQQTLSVRISEALRTRLEQARKLMSTRTGESVSTSEIAKQLLESAREDRLEVVDMLVNPTEALIQIRRKGEAQHILTRAEWTAVAHFVQQGLEAFSGKTPNPVSRESLGDVLDAFLAVYELRSDQRASKRDEYFLENLPRDCRPGKLKTSNDGVTSDTVRRTVIETRKRLSDATTRLQPLLAGRNLLVLLEDEKLSGADDVDRALRPFWPGLWRLAARGHYHLTQKPVRIKPSQRESVLQRPIASIREGEYTLSFSRGEGHDFSMLLSFPGPQGPMYPFSWYPKMQEFRNMLEALTPESSTSCWDGEYFFGYARQEDDKEKVKDMWFRAHDNGITFGFTEKDWKSIRALFRRAWAVQEVRVAWDGLALEYGEL